jgi:hypothetical protein
MKRLNLDWLDCTPKALYLQDSLTHLRIQEQSSAERTAALAWAAIPMPR